MKSVSEKLKGLYLYFELVSEFVGDVRIVEVRNENVLKFKPYIDDDGGVYCESFSKKKDAYRNKVIDQYWIDMNKFNPDDYEVFDIALYRIMKSDFLKGMEAIVKLIENEND